jgi:hypothetical protein
MKTPILGQAYVARSINAANNRMVNLFPEIVPDGGLEAAFLNRAPGLNLLATIGSGPIRGLWTYDGVGYVVSGTALYSINTSYTATLRSGATSIAGTGTVSMSDNGTQMFIATSAGTSYIYNKSTTVFAQITDADFPGASVVGYLDGYFVFIEPSSQRFWVTSLLDGTSVDPLDFASAEGSPDGLVSMIIDHRECWLFGTNSVEVWYNAGNADFPLSRIQGAFNEIGCAATYSVAKLDNGIFWLGADARGQGIVYRANGYTGSRVSTHAVEYAIAQYSSISDAVAYTYQQEGHSFYFLTFPTGNATWVYDVATGTWAERAGFSNGSFTRHRSSCQMAFNNEIILGDYVNGKVYSFDLDIYADDSDIQKWLRSWRAIPTGQNDLKRSAHHSLQLEAESGVGLSGNAPEDATYLITESGNFLITESGLYLITDDASSIVQGANPQVMLRWSDDGGHTWSNEHWESMGRIGQYGYRTIWRRLGMTEKLRDRVYEISGTDPVKVSIMGAELYITQTTA